MNGNIIIKSRNGIGDLLFVTPTLRKIKEYYPDIHITINTNYPELLFDNPYIDKIGNENAGLFLGYPDPVHCKNPIMHHIQFDYQLVRNHFQLFKMPLFLDKEDEKPEIYNFLKGNKNKKIGVQVYHKGHWHLKKVWPFFKELCSYRPDLFEPIKMEKSISGLINKIASYRAVLCAEGGISHIAKAVNTHAIVIYGGFAKPEWNGYQDHNNICNVLPCSYCYNSHPCASKVINRECLYNIRIAQVLRQVDGLEKIPEMERGNAKQFVEKKAYKYCIGKGLDVGAGRFPLNGSIPVDIVNGNNAINLEFENNSMDYVFSSHCLEHIEQYQRALSEMERVLKPGGFLFLYLPHPDYLPWRKENLSWHKQDLYPKQIEKDLLKLDLKKIYCKEKDFYFGHIHIYQKKGRDNAN